MDLPVAHSGCAASNIRLDTDLLAALCALYGLAATAQAEVALEAG